MSCKITFAPKSSISLIRPGLSPAVNKLFLNANIATAPLAYIYADLAWVYFSGSSTEAAALRKLNPTIVASPKIAGV